MRSPSSKLFLFTALTGVLLLPALSFAGPGGHRGGDGYNSGHGKHKRFKRSRPAKRGPYAKHHRAHARHKRVHRAMRAHKRMKRQRRQVAYHTRAPRHVVHMRRRAPAPPVRRWVTTRRYIQPAALGFRGNSVRLLQRGTCNAGIVRYPSGRLAAAGMCRRGLKRGAWTAYDRRGHTIAGAQFRRGVQLSSWVRHNGHGPKVYRRGRHYGEVYTPRHVRVRPVRVAHHARQRIRVAGSM